MSNLLILNNLHNWIDLRLEAEEGEVPLEDMFHGFGGSSIRPLEEVAGVGTEIKLGSYQRRRSLSSSLIKIKKMPLRPLLK